jgi:hypothetical protein
MNWRHFCSWGREVTQSCIKLKCFGKYVPSTPTPYCGQYVTQGQDVSDSPHDTADDKSWHRKMTPVTKPRHVFSSLSLSDVTTLWVIVCWPSAVNWFICILNYISIWKRAYTMKNIDMSLSINIFWTSAGSLHTCGKSVSPSAPACSSHYIPADWRLMGLTWCGSVCIYTYSLHGAGNYLKSWLSLSL